MNVTLHLHLKANTPEKVMDLMKSIQLPTQHSEKPQWVSKSKETMSDKNCKYMIIIFKFKCTECPEKFFNKITIFTCVEHFICNKWQKNAPNNNVNNFCSYFWYILAWVRCKTWKSRYNITSSILLIQQDQEKYVNINHNVPTRTVPYHSNV